MSIILNLTWATMLLPLVGVALSFVAETPRRAAQTQLALTLLALGTSTVVLIFRLTHAIPVYDNTQTFWSLPTTSSSPVDAHLFANAFLLLWGIRVDPLSVGFMTAVLALSVAAQLHALVSVRVGEGFRRCFWVCGLLTAGLLAMVASPNLFQLWVGWEVTGVAAWLLAGHLWQRHDAAAAATRLYILLRGADVAFLLAIVFTVAKFNVVIGGLTPPPGQSTADPLGLSVLAFQWHAAHGGAVAGVGARTLVVTAVLFLVAAAVRAGVGPLHVWLTDALHAPPAGVALLVLCGPMAAAILVARVYPLLLEALGVLAALAVCGAVSALTGAILALGQRDILRAGMFAVISQAGLVLIALGMGGFSPGLFITFTGSCLSVLFFLASGNLIRAYRTRDLTEMGGARRRLPGTSLALFGWALGISGLSLNSYSALSAALRNTTPAATSVASAVEVVSTVVLLAVMVLTPLYAFRIAFRVAGGEPLRRRGFDLSRLRDVEPVPRRAALLALAAAVAATAVGIPGVNAFRAGGARVPGLTFSHFVFYGQVRQQLAVNVVAIALCVVLAVAGIGAAWLIWLRGGTLSSRVRERLAPAGRLFARPSAAEGAAGVLGALAIRAGQQLDRVDREVVEPVPDAIGEAASILVRWSGRTGLGRSPAVGLAVALVVVVVVLAASLLAATGHLPVSPR